MGGCDTCSDSPMAAGWYVSKEVVQDIFARNQERKGQSPSSSKCNQQIIHFWRCRSPFVSIPAEDDSKAGLDRTRCGQTGYPGSQCKRSITIQNGGPHRGRCHLHATRGQWPQVCNNGLGIGIKSREETLSSKGLQGRRRLDADDQTVQKLALWAVLEPVPDV